MLAGAAHRKLVRTLPLHTSHTEPFALESAEDRLQDRLTTSAACRFRSPLEVEPPLRSPSTVILPMLRKSSGRPGEGGRLAANSVMPHKSARGRPHQ